jgi:hypothetical protein
MGAEAMSPVQVKRWTREDHDRMIDAGIFTPGERVELIDGEIIERSIITRQTNTCRP